MSAGPNAVKERSLISEVGTFGTGLGVMLAVAAYFLLTGLKGTPPVAGLARSMVLGLPVAVLAAGNIVTGIWTLTSRSSAAIGGVIVCGAAVATAYLAFEIVFMGYPFAGRLLSVVVYLIPVMLIVRGFKALDEARVEQRKRAVAEREAKGEDARTLQ
jgi:hypothetical protein